MRPDRDGGAPSSRLARRALALVYEAPLLAGVGFLWALADREGPFLHDRLAGTRIVKDEG